MRLDYSNYVEYNNSKPKWHKPTFNHGVLIMDHKFYDVKTKQHVSTAITEVKSYGEGNRTRYAVKGVTKDGRPLTAFVSKADWEKAKAAVK